MNHTRSEEKRNRASYYSYMLYTSVEHLYIIFTYALTYEKKVLVNEDIVKFMYEYAVF